MLTLHLLYNYVCTYNILIIILTDFFINFFKINNTNHIYITQKMEYSTGFNTRLMV